MKNSGAGVKRPGFRFCPQHLLNPAPGSSSPTPHHFIAQMIQLGRSQWGGCYQGGLCSISSIFSELSCMRLLISCLFLFARYVSYRHFKKDEAVWYFSRQLCKAFISIKKTEKHRAYFLSEDEASFMNWSLHLNTESVRKLMQLVKKEGAEKCVSNPPCIRDLQSAEDICMYMAAPGSCSSPCRLGSLIWSSVHEQH